MKSKTLVLLSILLCLCLSVWGGVDFNGDGDYIDSTYVPNVNTKTLSFWMNLDNISTSRTIGAHDAANHRFYLGTVSVDDIFLGYGDKFINSEFHGIGTGEWHHWLVTGDGSTMEVYIDGVDMNSGVSSATMGTSSTNFYIGGRSGGSPNYVDGKVRSRDDNGPLYLTSSDGCPIPNQIAVADNFLHCDSKGEPVALHALYSVDDFGQIALNLCPHLGDPQRLRVHDQQEQLFL